MHTSIHGYLFRCQLESPSSRSIPCAFLFEPFLDLLLLGSPSLVSSTPTTQSQLLCPGIDFEQTPLLVCAFCIESTSQVDERFCSSEESSAWASLSSLSVTGLWLFLTVWGSARVCAPGWDCSWGRDLLGVWWESGVAEELPASGLWGLTAAILGAWEEELRGPPLEIRVQVMETRVKHPSYRSWSTCHYLHPLLLF